jgi:hypothetical protein
LQGAYAVVLALRFTVLKGVIDEIAGLLTGKLICCRKGNPLGQVVAGWLPAGARSAMPFGTLSADLFESAGNRSPEPAVLFYATDDERAGEEVERLIRTAGFEPVKAGGIEQSGRFEVGGQGTLCGPIAQGRCSPSRRPRPSNKLITDTTGGGTKTWRTAPCGGESSERAGSRAHS